MCQITFKRVTPEESRIFADGEYVGDVYRHDDILREGAHYYVVSLDEDWRGPVRARTARRPRSASGPTRHGPGPRGPAAGDAGAPTPAAVPGREAVGAVRGATTSRADVIAHCPTRARSSNPAGPPVAPLPAAWAGSSRGGP